MNQMLKWLGNILSSTSHFGMLFFIVTYYITEFAYTYSSGHPENVDVDGDDVDVQVTLHPH